MPPVEATVEAAIMDVKNFESGYADSKTSLGDEKVHPIRSTGERSNELKVEVRLVETRKKSSSRSGMIAVSH
jgi:hypothetical protein